MTAKAALAGLAHGGGKAVIIGDPSVVKTPSLLRDFAAAVNRLGGRYITAEDVGTTQNDMDLIQGTTPFVAGTSTSRGGSGDPSPVTARGVVVAMEAAAARRWGTGLEGRTVLVLGAGKVGAEVIRLLVQRDAVVIASDVDPGRVEEAVRAGAARIVEPADALRRPADILCPCALGGVLTDEVVADLNVEIIVGGANNQLATSGVAETLAAADTLYVPDFLANAGGIINIAQEPDGYDRTLCVARRRPDPRDDDHSARTCRGAGHHSAGCRRGAGRRTARPGRRRRGCWGADVGVTDVQTARLQLHAIDVAEGQRIVARIGGPGDSWAPDFPFEGDVGAVGGFLRATAASGDQRPFGYYLISRLADGRAVGGIGFKGQPEGGCVEIGYGLAPSARGQGYAAEAVVALLALAAEHGVSRVIADTTLDNIASQRTLVRAGFRFVRSDDELHYYEVLLAPVDATAGLT